MDGGLGSEAGEAVRVEKAHGLSHSEIMPGFPVRENAKTPGKTATNPSFLAATYPHALEKSLNNFDEEYRLAHANYPLFSNPAPPALLTKSFDSFLDKTYRINILHNNKWPGQPTWLGQKGWILPHNWCEPTTHR